MDGGFACHPYRTQAWPLTDWRLTLCFPQNVLCPELTSSRSVDLRTVALPRVLGVLACFDLLQLFPETGTISGTVFTGHCVPNTVVSAALSNRCNLAL